MKNLLTTQEQKDDFDSITNDYKKWFDKTRSLHKSAKILFDTYKKTLHEMQKSGKSKKVPTTFFISDQVLILEGFAIENLLKGTYVMDGGILAKDGKLEKIAKTHDLIKLCKITNSTLNEKEKKLFELLSIIITSYGRYPIPLHYQINPLKKTNKGYNPRYQWSHDDMVLIDNFIISFLGEDNTKVNTKKMILKK